jgi:PKD repeat protein
MKKSALLLISILLLATGYSQKSPADSATWIVYDSTNTPMPGSFIFDVAVDWNNNKWVSNPSGGIFRFDGTTWTQFSTSNSGLPSNYVYTVAIDSMGRKWFGTDLDGLAQFDDSLWTVYNTTNSSIPSNTVLDVKPSNGDIWIGTNAGLAKLSGTTWTIYNTGNSGIPGQYVNCIDIDSYGYLWVATDNGVGVFNGTSWVTYNTGNSGIIANWITSISIDSNGNKWFGTTNGISKFTGTTWTNYNTGNSGLPDNNVRDLECEYPNLVWIPTLSGLTVFNGTSWTIYNMGNSGMPTNYARCITVQNPGQNSIKWIGTENGGLVQYGEQASLTDLVVKGYVTDIANGNAIPNKSVYIQSDSSASSFYYYKEVFTNNNGFYADTIVLPTGVTSGNMVTTVFDCNYAVVTDTLPFNPGAMTLQHDFVICDTTPTSCLANFTYGIDSINPNTVHFVDLSMWSIGSWHWDFGDGNTSNSQNPTHTYTGVGLSYVVCLTIVSNDSLCTDTFCDTITPGVAGCQAYFTYYPDSTSSNTLFFIDQSSGNITSWYWNFGDGSPVVTSQNPAHVFLAAGTYSVCLTIQGGGCTSTFCKDVFVNNSGCHAMFTYYADTVSNLSLVHFIDQSSGSMTSWFWDFGDPGSGTNNTSNLQNPEHYYTSPGVYTACLTIGGDSCQDTYCQQVVVLDSIQLHQVYGQVFAGNFPLTLGMAMIFSYDTSFNYMPYVSVCPIDSNGVYYFTQVPDGQYFIYAIPFDSTGYLPTYYGNVVYWEDATVINLGEPANPYNISLAQSFDLIPGIGSITGQITLGSLKSTMVDKIVMLLFDDMGHALTFSMVDDAGEFVFPSLDYGTYYLYAELSGVTSQYIRVDILPGDWQKQVTLTFAGNQILGVNENKKDLVAGELYPNPARTSTTVVLDLTTSGMVTAEVYNLTGQKVYTAGQKAAQGKVVITIPTAGLPEGIYTVRILTGDGLQATRKLVKTE